MDSTDDFISNLDEQSLQRAKDELNEDDKNRSGAVDTFREWVVQQKWLKTPTDTRFLLRFLRVKKYSQLEARKALEKYWRSRTEIPEWFKNRDPTDTNVMEVVKMGMWLKLPRVDRNGRIHVLQRPGCLNLEKVKNDLGGADAVYKAYTMLVDWIAMDPRAQVNGIVILADGTGYDIQHKLLLHSIENIKKLTHTMPGNQARIKGINVYKFPPVFEAILGIVKSFLKPKLRNRLKSHRKTMVSVYEAIDMSVLPKEYLPDEYTGPCSGRLEEILEYNIREITKPHVIEHIKSISNSDYGVNLTLKPSEEEVPSESFRKLCVD